ncbi:hypothetical protein P7F88_17770 [Vibrio hannami]|uniref:hypothetical protein n=1 Tax=Vibrio hannami TaxID=2717094 RepID=UPI00240F8C68|nr:hypothetical protein [Vibrio hannami]MDG3087815.1 hypothetical protein [Vibrio hannami]
MKRLGLLFILSTILSGCSSTSISPKTEVKPVPFSEENSLALNIANQTFLTQPYKWGLETYSSPLRDFSDQEISSIEKAFSDQRASVSFAHAAFSLVTHDFTGAAIHATGGTLETMFISDHIATQPAWLVAVDATKYSDGIEANIAANELIKSAILETLRDKGNVLTEIVITPEGKATFGGKIYKKTAYALGEDKLTIFGLWNDDFELENGMQLGRTNLINAESQYVKVWDSQSFGLGSIYLFLDGKIKGYEGMNGWEQYAKDVTARLPEGFSYYMPPLPKTRLTTVDRVEDWQCSKCRESQGYTVTSILIPHIYTQGQKYEFRTKD